tara:strand:+ start:10491 stop:10691 length:201 start_codon:yes stop_codon:yes gene_type:complete
VLVAPSTLCRLRGANICENHPGFAPGRSGSGCVSRQSRISTVRVKNEKRDHAAGQVAFFVGSRGRT